MKLAKWGTNSALSTNYPIDILQGISDNISATKIQEVKLWQTV